MRPEAPRLKVLLDRLPSRTPIWLCGAFYCLAVGFFLSLFVHSDLLYNAYVSNAVARGHLDVYDYFSNAAPLRSVETVMPPLYYLFTGGYLKLLSLVHLDPVTTIRSDMFRSLFGHQGNPSFYLGAILLKLPNVVALGAGTLLTWRLAVRSRANHASAIILWLASPALIVTALMQAQNDILASVISVGALWAFSRGWPVRAMLLLGVAASFKNYALILIPLSALALSDRKPIQALKLLTIGLLPCVITIAPFWDAAFIERVLHAHDSATALGGPRLGQFQLPLWPLAYAFLLTWAWWMAKRSVDAIDLAALWSLSLLALFVLSWWRPQWVVWIVPMAAILAALDRRFLRIWLAVNAAVILNGFLMMAGNTDGAMLLPTFGAGQRPISKHLLYLSHLFPAWAGGASYVLCVICFALLALRSWQWIHARDKVADVTNRTWRSSQAAIAEACLAPACMVPCVAAMAVQHVA